MTLRELYSGPYNPHTGCTGQFMNHAPAIQAALALIYSRHLLLVVWITVAYFHLCSLLLSRYTVLDVTVDVFAVAADGDGGMCVLFINVLDSLTTPCLAYTAGAATMAGTWFIHLPVQLMCRLYGPAVQLSWA